MKKRSHFGNYIKVLLTAGCLTLLDGGLPAGLPLAADHIAMAADLTKSAGGAPVVMAEEQSYDNVAISQVTDYVNVRQEANTQSAIVGVGEHHLSQLPGQSSHIHHIHQVFLLLTQHLVHISIPPK